MDLDHAVAMRREVSPAGVDIRHLVITVHGIRTFGNWQERLEVLLQNRVEVRSRRRVLPQCRDAVGGRPH